MKALARRILREEIARDRTARLAAEDAKLELQQAQSATLRANVELYDRIAELATPTSAHDPGRPTAERLASQLALLTFVVAILFGLTWMTYRRAYGTFGLTPDEVGLDYAAVLSRAATGFGVIALFGVLSWGASWLFGRLAAPADTPPTGLRDIFAGTIIAEFVIGLYFLLSAGTLPVVYLGWFALAVAVELTCLALVLPHRSGTPWVRSVDRAIGMVSTWLRVPAVVTSLVLLLLTPSAAGSNLATLLKDGGAGPNHLFPELVDAKVVPVDVYWIPGNPPSALSAPNSAGTQQKTLAPFYDPQFYYLGQSGDLVVLYDLDSHRILRISSQNIVLHSYSFS